MSLLLPHTSNILDLIRRCLADEERTDAIVRLSYGLIGDLADSFQQGQMKQLLLQQWLATELRTRSRMSTETKKTMRWAREVLAVVIPFLICTDAGHVLQMVKIATGSA